MSKYLKNEVSTHHWDQGSSARCQYYYFVSQYLTPWCQYTWLRQSFYCWRSVLLHWVQVSDNWSKYLSLRPSSTARGQYKYIVSNIWHMKSVHITETKILLIEVSTTTLSPSIWHHGVSTHDWGNVSTAGGLYYHIESQYLSQNIWHMKSLHITEAKYLLLEVSTTTLSPCISHNDVSTHHWGQGSTAIGQF